MIHLRNIIFALLACGMLMAFASERPMKLPKLFKKEYAFIPAAELTLDDKVHDVAGFYLCKHEVSNLEYREFYWYIKNHRPELLPVVRVDSTGWNQFKLAPLAEHYHHHGAYAQHPVVNISHEAALLYCAWLTEFNREQGLFAKMDGYKVTYRLPTREEWVHAANGQAGRRIFSWDGHYVRDTKGMYLANFQRFPELRMHYNIENRSYHVVPWPENSLPAMDTRDRDDLGITAPGISYAPSDLGLYHMNGNVAEMLAEPGVAAGGSWLHTAYDIRNESTMEYDGPSALVGFRVLAVVEPL